MQIPSALRSQSLRGEVLGMVEVLERALTAPDRQPELGCRVLDGLRGIPRLSGAPEDRLRAAKGRLRLIVSGLRGLGLAPVPAPGRRGLLGETTAAVGPPNRPSCLNCVEKHLGSAYVLLSEVRHGYPHRMMAMGHLQEAEDESQEYPALHNAIRDARKGYQVEGKAPDWFGLADLLEKSRGGA